MNSPLDTLRERLRLLRRRLDLSQADLAIKLGISQDKVSRWEAGKSYPDARELLAMSDLFDVAIAFIVGTASLESGLTPGHTLIDPEAFDEVMRGGLLDEESSWAVVIPPRAQLVTQARYRDMRRQMAEELKRRGDG